MKKSKVILWILTGLATVILLALPSPKLNSITADTFVEAEITSPSTAELSNGESITLTENEYETGDKVVLSQFESPEGETLYFVTDQVRRPALLWLFALFVVVVLAVTSWQGAKSLLGLAFSFLVLFKATLPLILTGFNPLWVTLASAALILPVIFYLSHGLNKKTSSALIGTLSSLLVTGLLAWAYLDIAHLTGFATEESSFLSFANAEIDFRGLVLAGLIISVLGILDDITVTQASVVAQLKASKKKIDFTELFIRSMQVGKDHIASLVNTLVLVYAGASLPLLLLFISDSFTLGMALNVEMVAEELVRMLIGSIGLVLAVPLTTLIAALWVPTEPVPPHSTPGTHSHD